MLKSIRVITEQQSDHHWTAWFSDAPHLGAEGELPSEAILRLLILFTDANYDVDAIYSIDDASQSGHLEFLIPRIVESWWPKPSVN